MAVSTPALEFSTTLSSNPVPAAQRAEILASPGFGTRFTDHMISATWTPEAGWHDAGLRPYAPLSLDPATATLHYAQAIFEGLKAYRHDDGSIWAFRPEANGARFARSAARMALPELPVESFVESLDLLVRTDAEWVPSGSEASLYLRPFMFASEVFLGVRPAKHVTYAVIASPAGAYFASGVKPVSIWLTSEYTRAAPGGTGAAKCAGNYAASLIAQQEALENGCDQVCFLDALEGTWVEELGGMNLYFVRSDGSVTTPELTGTILEGITRDSILTLAADLGHKVEERPVSIDEWRDGVASGEITEVFACGTAAAITPLGRLAWDGGELSMGERPGPVTQALREALLDVQYGRAPDRHGWMHRIA
ncbi:branched-chain amino acid aminotransferase [Actinobacteria bacterium YIM 96077]|uniref:Branched-chain-amino-acid aminotransferase n=1 Tax=Phytoactinopolyspora halophila TaxID=1981511 RepID=A0A329QDZ3_9ACTN|nr:branched-chain amino acid aminotransferase [Phytoactinopolyspora halophila]AYY12507.1 branched-chain amino acid aminotransferase [Actinobacteria bacterium YIM 96077]RAW09432.1 branched chain amino acid aminotransferase [Phytoactinopolyspora halophila]